MAWNSFTYVENQGEITGKSFREQTEQAINDVAEFANSAIEIGIGDAAEKAGELASEKAIEEVKRSAVTTTPQTLPPEKQSQARANIGLSNVVTRINGDSGDVVFTYVASFNGQSGDVTYTPPVESVNGQTGAVVLDLTGAVKSVNGQTGAVTVNVDDRILKAGKRGKLSGSEVATVLTGGQTIDASFADTSVIKTSGATTLYFVASPETVCAVKTIALKATATTTLTINGAVWANLQPAPKWGTQGKNLVLIAHFIGGRVVLSVSDNDE